MPEVKDKMTGKTVANMPYDSAGKMAAEKMVTENPGYEIKDGAQRMESYQLGGQVPGQAGFGQRPQPVNPGEDNQLMESPIGGEMRNYMFPQEENIVYEKGGKTLSYAEAQAEQKRKYEAGVAERKAKYESRDEKPKAKAKTKKKKSYNELRQEASNKYKSFGQSFKRARESGVKTFNWKGKKYTTKRK